MLKKRFGKEESYYFSNHQMTPLHFASEIGYLEIVKYLIERGADVNSVWSPWSLKYRLIVFSLINNFNDPFYQRFESPNKITKLQMNTLIENGMI